MKIIFEPHATTFDNEAKIASGWNDAALSPLGERQAKELGERYGLDELDAVFTADLQRGYRTAELAFPGIEKTGKLQKDARLRECDYGDYTQHPRSEVDPIRIDHIDRPFPNGKSYKQMLEGMRLFLAELRQKPYDSVLIIGSRATHYGLDVAITGKSLEECINNTFKWQPGWEYELK